VVTRLGTEPARYNYPLAHQAKHRGLRWQIRPTRGRNGNATAPTPAGCLRHCKRVFGTDNDAKEHTVAKDHGPSVKDDKQYEGLRKKGMSKSRAAAISNSPGASSRGGKSAGSAQSSSGSGGNQSQKKAAGRKGGKKSS
jgi:hypothetical protein